MATKIIVIFIVVLGSSAGKIKQQYNPIKKVIVNFTFSC